jgi:Ran GTPase-activating protein (RanGAP) involved in mRNA processing and transport
MVWPSFGQALGEVIRKHMKLKELHLHNNKLGYEGVEKLSQELAKPLSKSSSKPGNKILEVLVCPAQSLT